MKRNVLFKWMNCITVLLLLLLVVTIPAKALESKGGDKVVIEEGEVIEDDLYAAGNTVEIKGTIQGDLVAAGSLIIIDETGIVEGDLLAVGQGIVIKGTVKDDVRIAGAVLSVGEKAKIGSDLVAFGYSLTTSQGAVVGKDTVFFGGQGLLAGDITRNAKIATGGLQLDGKIGGNVEAEVGGAQDVMPFSPLSFMPAVPGMPQAPTVVGGLTIGNEAKIGGNLNYTGPEESKIPDGIVGGNVGYKAPPPPSAEEAAKAKPPTAAEKILTWFLEFLRELVSLFLVGLLFVYLAPKVLDAGADIIQSKPWHSILWGILAYIAIIFALFLLVVVVILVMVILGLVTLGGLAGTAFGLGVVTVSGLALVFHVAVSYLSKILVSFLVGRLIFSKAAPERTQNRLLPFVVGLLIVVLLASIPILGIVVNIVAVLLGLGALWLLGREWWTKRTVAVEAPTTAPAD